MPVPLAPSSITETLAVATRSIVLATLSISGADVIIDPNTARAALRLKPPVFRLDVVEVEGAGDDQAEIVDIDRLAIEVIGSERDRLERAFARRHGPTRR